MIRRQNILDRFFSNVQKTNSCWNWTGYKFSNEYGAIRYKGKIWRAHRLSWTLFNGDIPKRKLVLHTCDTPPCVNPGHLWIGTHQDNMTDRNEKRRQYIPNGEKNSQAKLKECQVKEIREMYKSGNLSQEKIGEIFNVSRALISMIIHRKKWAHI